MSRPTNAQRAETEALHQQGLRCCSKCKATKPESDFHRGRSSYGLSSACRDCNNADNRARYHATPEQREAAAERSRKAREADRERYNRYSRDYKRREALSKYGLTPEDYDRIYAKQGGCCAICKDPLQGGREQALDHCHVGGHFRGILCRPCNQGIGFLRDDPTRLRAAAAYLESATVQSPA